MVWVTLGDHLTFLCLVYQGAGIDSEAWLTASPLFGGLEEVKCGRTGRKSLSGRDYSVHTAGLPLRQS